MGFFSRRNFKKHSIQLDSSIIRNISDLFYQKSKTTYFQNKNVVLIIDEIDSLTNLDDETRKKFLGSLSSIKQTKDIYCLWSCLIITNWIGPYIYDTLGSSPFPMSVHVDSPNFSSEETKKFFKEIEKEYEVEIEENIKENIYEITGGSQGLIVILTLYYLHLINLLKKNITFEVWYNSSLSSQMWEYIQGIDNFNQNRR